MWVKVSTSQLFNSILEFFSAVFGDKWLALDWLTNSFPVLVTRMLAVRVLLFSHSALR